LAQTKVTEKVINGVNVNKLHDAIVTCRDNPEMAVFKFRAMNRWVCGGHCSTTIQDFYGLGREDTTRSKPFVLEADEPEALLGEDYGPNATEAVLYALSSCLVTTCIYHAAAHGIKIDQLELDLEGELDLRGFLGISDDIRRGYQNIKAVFRIKSDAPREKLEQAMQMAQKYSPVFDIVTNKVPVTAELQTL